MSEPIEYKIRLEGVRFRGCHGVSDSERSLPQDFLVSLQVALPASRLPETDTYPEVFDYDRLASIVVEEGTTQSFQLLETLAQRLIGRVLRDTPATWVTVSITKTHPPTQASVDSVSVELAAFRSKGLTTAEIALIEARIDRDSAGPFVTLR